MRDIVFNQFTEKDIVLTRSKAFRKSTNIVRTESPESNDDIQVCNMDVSA